MIALLVVTAEMEPIWPLVAVAGSVLAIVLVERAGPKVHIAEAGS